MLQWGRVIDNAEIRRVLHPTGVLVVLQWGRVNDDAERAAVATGGRTTTCRAVFERWR